ncbi:MAG TPA: cyclic nucleotide-binding domain-containing protein [Rhodospirillales bacterium]|jgi:CRP-like cAMP-binding protein
MIDLGALKSTDLFHDLPDRTLKTIAGFSSAKSIEEGDHIYQLGDDASDLYLLMSGRVRFSLGVGNRPGASGSLILPGQVFGWAALLQERPRRVATATCLEDSELYVIPGAKLLDLFDREKAAGYVVMRRLATMITRDFSAAMSV